MLVVNALEAFTRVAQDHFGDVIGNVEGGKVRAYDAAQVVNDPRPYCYRSRIVAAHPRKRSRRPQHPRVEPLLEFGAEPNRCRAIDGEEIIAPGEARQGFKDRTRVV